MKKKLRSLMPYIGIVVIVLIIRSFIITPVRVNGPSMEDSLYNGDILILNKLNNDYKRFDIVVVDQDITGEPLIKRIIGLPGDKIEIKNGEVYINSEKLEDVTTNEVDHEVTPITLEDDEYYLLGDNRSNSYDSSELGVINKKNISGVVSLRIYPFNNIGIVD